MTAEFAKDTLADAQDMLAREMKTGVDCPCCGQRVKIYKRKLYDVQASWLVWLVSQHRLSLAVDGSGWVKVSAYPLPGGDYGKTTFWGLAELRPKDPTDTTRRTSGMWRPTQLGIDFVFGRVSVPEFVMVYNNNVVDVSDTQVHIQDVLGAQFSYLEITG